MTVCVADSGPGGEGVAVAREGVAVTLVAVRLNAQERTRDRFSLLR